VKRWRLRKLKFGSKAGLVTATMAATLLVLLIVANLTLGEKPIDTKVAPLYATSDPQFARTMNMMLGPALLEGNRVTTLLNGEQIFPAMLEAIRGAKKTITFETYIYWSGEVGDLFSAALAERAQAGVKVHLMFDAVGSDRIDRDAVRRMQAAGVQIERYNPVRWYTVARMNNRSHRKLLVVDGRIGFTGGVGIADMWRGNAQDPEHWRDTHYRIEGPAVAQMQAAFNENWTETTGVVLHGEDYFPPLARAGAHTAHLFTSSPGGSGGRMQLMYLLSIAAARHTIHLSAAYFVPDQVERRMLVEALERGVKLQIIVPGPHTDARVVRRASRATWGDLLRAGAEIYEFQPTMFHCKVMVVDGLWTSVGSTNFDSRSFSVNDEANLDVLHAGFAREQIEVFRRDLERSKRIALQEWENRPWRERLWERTVGLLRAQL
jgi:cardiolipin synthase